MSEYKISRTLAVASENADLSGLSGSDIESLEKFEAHLIETYGHALWVITDWAEESTDINARCEIHGLMDHCVTIEIE